MFVLEKQPSEVIPCVINFSRVLPTGETAGASSTITITDEDGLDVSDDMLVGTTISSPNVSGVIQGGDDGENYTATFKCITTPTGYLFEEDVQLRVRER